jgi:hypothetical protein
VKTAESLAVHPLEKGSDEADMALLEKYQDYSAELLRIALIALGVQGFIERIQECSPHD